MNQTIIEHGTSKTFYPNVVKQDENYNRMEWRKSTIDYITGHSAKDCFKFFPDHIYFNSENVFVWDLAKLELEEDINLIFKYNICANTHK